MYVPIRMQMHQICVVYGHLRSKARFVLSSLSLTSRSLSFNSRADRCRTCADTKFSTCRVSLST